jgi:hypothetical protein
VLKNIQGRVDDGVRHIIIVKQNGTRFSLEVDGYVQHGETRPSGKETINLPGHFLLGGAPDIGSFTGSRYAHSFNGCIHATESLDGSVVNLSYSALNGVNVDQCPNEDLSSEEPRIAR